MYDLEPGYDSAYTMLGRMVADQLVRKHKAGYSWEQDLYSAYADRRGPSTKQFGHEVACGDLYVAFQKTGLAASWSTRWKPHQRHQFARECGINPDGMLELDGCSQVIFFEVDMGTEDFRKLDAKIDRYVNLATMTSPFAVVFCFKDNPQRAVTWKPRALAFNADVAAKRGRGRQFSAAPHYLLRDAPLAQCIFSYKSPVMFSVLDLAR